MKEKATVSLHGAPFDVRVRILESWLRHLHGITVSE